MGRVTPVEAAAATLDPHLVGCVQQMFQDNQFFATMQEHIKGAGFRTLAGLAGPSRRLRRDPGPAAEPVSLANDAGRRRTSPSPTKKTA